MLHDLFAASLYPLLLAALLLVASLCGEYHRWRATRTPPYVGRHRRG